MAEAKTPMQIWARVRVDDKKQLWESDAESGGVPYMRGDAAFALLAACKEFVRKVDNGTARSVRSYTEMKAAISKYERNL